MPNGPTRCHACNKDRNCRIGQRRGPYWYCNLHCVADVEGPSAASIRRHPQPQPEPKPPPPIAAVVTDWLSLPLLARAEYLQAHGPQLTQGE